MPAGLSGYLLGVLPLPDVHFIVHGFRPLRASKTPQIAHVFAWPKRPMFAVFFRPLSPSQSAIMALKIAARNIVSVWARSRPCCHVPSYSQVFPMI
jgi:hypothetical protein